MITTMDIGYSHKAYPTTKEFISEIERNSENPTVEVDLFELGENGDFVNEPMQDYLRRNAMSSTALSKTTISPKAVKYEFDNQLDETKEKTKESQELGTLIHQALLEPDLFRKVKKEPNVDLRTTEGTKELIKFYISLRDPKPTYKGISKMKIKDLRKILHDERLVCKYYIVNESQMNIIEEIKKNYFLYGNGIIPQIMKGAVIEHSVYTKEESFLFPEKIRPDFINLEENVGVNIIGSLKSTSAKSFEEFKEQARKYKYALKEGFYQHVISHVTGRLFVTVMIGLQTTPPYDVFVWLWNERDVEIATKEAEYYLDIINDCFESGQFLGMESKAEEGNRGIIDFDLYGDYVPELPYFTV